MKQRFSAYGSFVKCPYPGCDHVGILLTKNHCESTHDMTKESIIKKYGNPTMVSLDSAKLRKNKKLMMEYSK